MTVDLVVDYDDFIVSSLDRATVSTCRGCLECTWLQFGMGRPRRLMSLAVVTVCMESKDPIRSRWWVMQWKG